MAESLKKITVNVPESLLVSVQKAIGVGTTQAVIEGLRELEKREKRSALRSLRGQVSFELDLKDLKRTRR